MRYLLLFLLVWPAALSAIAQGSGQSAYFDGGNYISCGNSEILRPTEALTIEAWVKPEEFTENWTGLFTYLQDNLANESGYGMVWLDDDKVCLYVMTEDAPSNYWNDAPGVTVPTGQWSHVAGTYDGEEIRMYLNGILMETYPLTGAIDWEFEPLEFRIGSFFDDNEDVRYNGELDEVRIWGTARSDEEIRSGMCSKVQADAPGLLAYWDFDLLVDGTFEDLSPANNDGVVSPTFFENLHSLTSTAPVGDTSSYLYGADLSGEIIDLISANGSAVTLEILDGNEGLHLYAISEAPNSNGGFQLPEAPNYFGIYHLGSGTMISSFEMDYSSYPELQSEEDLLSLYYRSDPVIPIWTDLSAPVDTDNDLLSLTVSLSGEFAPGITYTECTSPTDLEMINVSNTSAAVGWTPGSSSTTNVEWGLAGFDQGEGNLIELNIMNPVTIEGLMAETTYEIYVQDTCIGAGASEWVGPFEFSTTGQPALQTSGAGTALLFTGTQYMEVASSTALQPENSMTIEAWIRPNFFLQDYTGLVTYLQDNGGNESGYGLVYNNGKVRMFMMTEEYGANAWNNAPGAEVETGKWSHIAGTYDGETIRFYLNGHLIEEQFAGGDIDWEFEPLALAIGTFLDDNEDVRYLGSIDEIRIWEEARSEEEIRDKMCEKLSGEEDSLLAYWQLNDGYGTEEIFDMSANGHDGIPADDFNPQVNWITSGAYIGDSSVHVYAQEWADQSLSLQSAFGEGTISNINNAGGGVHLYLVEGPPNFTNGLSSIDENQHYFGAFLTTFGTNSEFVYDYGDFPEALEAEEDLNLANRVGNALELWNLSTSVTDSENDLVTLPLSTPRELYLQNVNFICSPPFNVGSDNIDFNGVGLIWEGEAGQSFNLEFGEIGYLQGFGTEINGIEGTSVNLTDLEAQTGYEFYIQSDCGDGFSPFVGPIPFNTLICQPSTGFEVIDATSTEIVIDWNPGSGDSFIVEWGVSGFSPGTGVSTPVDTPPATIGPLPANLEFDFYIVDLCGESAESSYYGPYSGSTLPVSLNERLAADAFRVFPNPTTNKIRILTVQSEAIRSIRIYELSGREIMQQMAYNGRSIDVSTLAAGMYVLSIETAMGMSTVSFVKL